MLDFHRPICQDMELQSYDCFIGSNAYSAKRQFNVFLVAIVGLADGRPFE